MTTCQTFALFVAIVLNIALVKCAVELEKTGRTKAAILTFVIGILFVNVVLGLSLHHLNLTTPSVVP